MPRQLRIEYEGAIYHVMSRGNGGKSIFLDNHDRNNFLLTLQEACSKASWQIHAYCLMNNHFHLVLETPKPTLIDGMKWMLGVYAQRFNTRHQHQGHLFAGRYKSLIVDESDDYYLRTVCDYVHLNPARAGLIKKGKPLESYLWSSFGAYLTPPSKRPSWLRVDRLLAEHGIQEDISSERKAFAILINERMNHEQIKPDSFSHKIIQKGWKLGGTDFVERLHQKIDRNPKKENHLAIECNETMEVKGRKIIQEKLRELHLTPAMLSSLPRMDPIKTELAQFLRAQTTLSLKWIAQELKAGAPGTLAVALHDKKKKDC